MCLGQHNATCPLGGSSSSQLGACAGVCACGCVGEHACGQKMCSSVVISSLFCASNMIRLYAAEWEASFSVKAANKNCLNHGGRGRRRRDPWVGRGKTRAECSDACADHRYFLIQDGGDGSCRCCMIGQHQGFPGTKGLESAPGSNIYEVQPRPDGYCSRTDRAASCPSMTAIDMGTGKDRQWLDGEGKEQGLQAR